MALGRRKRGPVRGELFVTAGDLPRSKGHPFYEKLNVLLESAKFDDFVEELVRPSYAEFVGRGAADGPEEGSAREAVGNGGADLRPHLRDGRSTADLPSGTEERPQALPDDGGREEFGNADAAPLWGRYAQKAAGYAFEG